jgi:hypothetical protein
MASNVVENPFGVMDVPDAYDADVVAFAQTAALEGTANDDNAQGWAGRSGRMPTGAIEGEWQSRWRGAADPTIPGDAPDKWKQGAGEVRVANDRVYLMFDWNGGVRKGMIEARREGTNRLVGKYINLTDPQITRPWIGLIVSNDRIDGRFPEGRLDFRR